MLYINKTDNFNKNLNCLKNNNEINNSYNYNIFSDTIKYDYVSKTTKISEKNNDFLDVAICNKSTALVPTKGNRLSIQNTLKKSVRVSLKSFLISIILNFINLFI